VTDRFTVRVVVLALAICVVIGVGGFLYLSSTQTPIPDQFDRLVTFLAGGLVGMLVRTGTDEPQPVVGEDGGPVEVAEVPPEARRRVLRAR
jgi:hypothetical protein